MISNNTVVKRQNYIFILALALLIIVPDGCAKKKKISGSYYIPRETMVQVLVDIYLLDGITDSYKYYRMYREDDTIDMQSEIFDKYNVNRERFDSTLSVYSSYPELLDKLYDEVIMNLNLIQDSLNAKPQKHEDLAPAEPEEKPEPRLKANSAKKRN